MDTVTIIDLVLLLAFIIFFSTFLYRNKKGLKKEGLLFLYKTSWGIKLIDYVGRKYKKTLKVFSYLSVAMGYILMISVVYMIYTIVKIYILNPSVVRAIKVPPILPLVPYIPQVFKLDFLPPFYFTYWIIILAVVAITHEFAHGIFAAYDKVRVKSTGFGFFPFFLPVFLAAFVELDEKVMATKKKFKQLAILSAGTFANVLTAVIFFVVLVLFFSLTFSAQGVSFDSYATSTVSLAGITMVNGSAVSGGSYYSIAGWINEEGLTEITASGKDYLITKNLFSQQSDNKGEILVYEAAPAIKAGLGSIITSINGVKIDSVNKLAEELSKHSPGEIVTVDTLGASGIEEHRIILDAHPENPEKAWLGIGFFNQKRTGFMSKIVNWLSSFKDPQVYYVAKFGQGISLFVYNLLWWTVLISISVALINMLPVGIFDGGRFFYLTLLGLTGNEKFARRAFAFTTYLFLFIVLLLMFFWGWSFIR